jgi:tight adherence protein B
MSLALVVFAAVAAVVLVPYGLFVLRPENEEQRRLLKRLKGERKRQVALAIVKANEQLSSIGFVDVVLARAKVVVSPIQRLIRESGKRLTVGRFLLATGVCGAVPLLLTTQLTGHLVAGLIVGALLAFVPTLWLRRARATRLWKFEEQFPEAIDLISRALRAGHTFPTGLSMVAEEMQAPVGTEFREIYDHQNFGMPMTDALRAFAERVPILDAKFFVTAVLTQRDAGGNLAEVLDNLSSVIRERFKVKRQVRVLSAHGRITGWVLAGLPPALAAVFAFVSPKMVDTLYHDPLGQQMIVVAIILQITGTLIIRKIINIEY